jgi:hypothetical protein
MRFELPISTSLLLANCSFVLVCGAWSSPASAAGSLVVEYYHAGLDNFFITSDPAEQAAVDSGAAGAFQRTGTTFAAGGPNPVCRFYGSVTPGPNSHFYTSDVAECEDLKRQQAITPASQKRWNFESNDFLTTSAVNGACPVGLVPVYRAYNNGFARGIDSNHRITSDLAAYQQTVAAGWKAEGVVMCAPAGGASVTIQGQVLFESVPTDTTTNGRLLYTQTSNKPVRGATVQILPAAGGAALAAGTTSSTGAYSLSIPTAQSVIVRVRAEMKKTSAPGGTWDFTVRDNTQGDGLYVLDTTPFTATTGATTRNMLAPSGWGGNGYSGARAAAPFAILDIVYDAAQKMLSASPNLSLPALQLMWSVNNRPSSGDLATGLIGTSFYRNSPSGGGRRIYILGAADTDTDEYDRPVVAHEFGHYVQDAFSRDDSIGGSHSSGDRLDMRVAFSEGWGNAWSGMALNTQYYTDSRGTSQQSGFIVNLAASPASNHGWFNERSVQYLFYQLHANPAIGFTPIFNVLAGLPATLPAVGALSSIHSFAYNLKLQVPGQAAAIDTLLSGEQILVTNALGAGETNDGGIPDALPVYRTHSAAIGASQNYCLTDAAGTGGSERNKLGANLFIRFTLGAGGTRSITVVSANGAADSDPDFVLYRNDGTKTTFDDGSGLSESTGGIPLAAGTHIIELYDYALTRGIDSDINNGRRCFDVTIN